MGTFRFQRQLNFDTRIPSEDGKEERGREMGEEENQAQFGRVPVSRYETNLAEFPLAVLSTRKPKDLKVIDYQDAIIGKNGTLIPRSWKVRPSAEFGFGSPQLLSTLFEIFQLWKEQGFKSKEVQFGTLYNLIKRRGVDVTGSDTYERMRTDLNTLVDLSIEAKNAFWDNEKKAYVDITFHLFESVRIYHNDPKNPKQEVLPFSSITASETLWHSIETNPLISLRGVDGKLFHSFSPQEQRLALYLGKRLRGKTEHYRDVDQLASQIPIYAKTYTDRKKILARRCDGLIKKAFPYLTRYHFEKKSGGHNIYFYRDSVKENQELKSKKQTNNQETTDLVRHFYKRFHDVENQQPSEKELAHAAGLISEYGFDRARYVVDFSKRVAPETNYNPQNFAGILSYTARAIADYEQGRGREQRKAAAATCSLCDERGFFTVEGARGVSTLVPCPHDPKKRLEYAAGRSIIAP